MTFGSFYTIFITSTDSFLNDSIQTSHSHSKRSQIQFFWVWVVCPDPERSFFLGSVSFSSFYVLCLPSLIRLGYGLGLGLGLGIGLGLGLGLLHCQN
jgi:hypothetical protein